MMRLCTIAHALVVYKKALWPRKFLSMLRMTLLQYRSPSIFSAYTTDLCTCIGKKVQSLYDSLELKDSEIYCKRAKEMYSSSEPLRTGLFVFSMKDTRLLAMFDPSMLGEEKLVDSLKDIDKIRYSIYTYVCILFWLKALY